MNLVDALKVNGKIKHKRWDNWYIALDSNKECFIQFSNSNQNGSNYHIAPSLVISEDWEPYKEPCKHEPMLHPSEDYIKLRCRHCQIKLRATGWEAVD